MFSQHPDHAGKPFWHRRKFIATHNELKECYLMYKNLGADEVMWDWEGKLVDESVWKDCCHNTGNFLNQNSWEKIFS